jgi:hypothetical protein
MRNEKTMSSLSYSLGRELACHIISVVATRQHTPEQFHERIRRPCFVPYDQSFDKLPLDSAAHDANFGEGQVKGQFVKWSPVA